jgi:hypothetical protein
MTKSRRVGRPSVRRRVLLAGAALCAALSASSPAAAAEILQTNPDGTVVAVGLVANGSAEDGLSGWAASPGWAVAEHADALEHLPFAGNGVSMPRTPRFFDPGAQADATLSQRIDLSAFAAAIDTGRQVFDARFLSYLWLGHPDTATLTLTALDASGGALASAPAAGGATPAERGNRSMVLWCGTGFPSGLPVGTRAVRLDIAATAPDGARIRNRAGVDAITATLGHPPAPAIGYHAGPRGCARMTIDLPLGPAPVVPGPPAAPAPIPSPPAATELALGVASARMRGTKLEAKLTTSVAGRVTLTVVRGGRPAIATFTRTLRRGTTKVNLRLSRAARKTIARAGGKVRLRAVLVTADRRRTTTTTRFRAST